MRLREREKQDVVLYPLTGMDDDVYTWGTGTAIRAAVYPGASALDPQVYGERVADTRLMLADGGARLDVGMGVSLGGGLPAYRIIALERWDHWRATLERIPEGRRGHAASV